ncbi:hypothetical protein CEXT_644921 [Caerostris extrusa]|uniref:Uncharacterized protein n=1 Tax=Caerostris extrusa TaxID=172846 RepID=A0AAV4UG85_CAEEX|nr:hypothetical protein CEXT_644921 [Caerostris extrusa]
MVWVGRGEFYLVMWKPNNRGVSHPKGTSRSLCSGVFPGNCYAIRVLLELDEESYRNGLTEMRSSIDNHAFEERFFLAPKSLIRETEIVHSYVRESSAASTAAHPPPLPGAQLPPAQRSLGDAETLLSSYIHPLLFLSSPCYSSSGTRMLYALKKGKSFLTANGPK